MIILDNRWTDILSKQYLTRDTPPILMASNNKHTIRYINWRTLPLRQLENSRRSTCLYSINIYIYIIRYRPSFPKAVIVMTDGIQTRDPDAVELDIAADPIHRQGARVLVIGIGPEISQNELRLIAKDPSFVFNVQSFESLSKAVRDVAASACVNTGNFLMLLHSCFCFCCCSWYFLRVKRLGFIATRVYRY